MDCQICDLVGTFADRSEDKSPSDEGRGVVEEDWSLRDCPGAPRLDSFENLLSVIAEVTDPKATELRPMSEGRMLLRVSPMSVIWDSPLLLETCIVDEPDASIESVLASPTMDEGLVEGLEPTLLKLPGGSDVSFVESFRVVCSDLVTAG